MAEQNNNSNDHSMRSIEHNTSSTNHIPHLSDQDERSQSLRAGRALMQSNDPSTAALRAWADDKSKHITGQDGSIATDWRSDEGFGWQANWLNMRKGDTQPPPDERVKNGEAMSVGVVEGEERVGQDHDGEKKSGEEGGKKRGGLSRLFHREDRLEDKAEMRDVVR